MKNNIDKMKELIEATGKCGHLRIRTETGPFHLCSCCDAYDFKHICPDCGDFVYTDWKLNELTDDMEDMVFRLPSHESIDALIIIADKLGFTHVRFAPCDAHQYAEVHDGEDNHWKYHAYEKTKAEALLGALHDSLPAEK